MAATPLALSSAPGEPGTVSYWAPISMGWSGESRLSVAMMFKPDRSGDCIGISNAARSTARPMFAN